MHMGWEEIGSLGKIFKATPSRALENALPESRIQSVFLLDLYADIGKLIPFLFSLSFDD